MHTLESVHQPEHIRSVKIRSTVSEFPVTAFMMDERRLLNMIFMTMDEAFAVRACMLSGGLAGLPD